LVASAVTIIGALHPTTSLACERLPKDHSYMTCV
jgi:hypothetical protein